MKNRIGNLGAFLKLTCLAGGLAAWFPVACSQEGGFAISIARNPEIQVRWASEQGFMYTLEAGPALGGGGGVPWSVVSSDIPGTGGELVVSDPAAGETQRFYRVVKSGVPGPEISDSAVEPETGEIYPAGTVLGSSFLGRQFTIPALWKGGVRQGTSSMLFASDTEPGLVIGFTTLTGSGQQLASQVGESFTAGSWGGFLVQGSPQLTGDSLSVEWHGVGFTDEGESLEGIRLLLHAVVHPSGGATAFAGFFLDAHRSTMTRVLNEFVDSIISVPRNTRTDLVDLLSGKSYEWVQSVNTGSGGSTGSLSRWTQKRAFLCPGTYEITTESESSYSGNVSGGAFYSGYSSSSSTEVGEWTIIDTAQGPVMVMMSSNGGQAALLQVSGNTVNFGNQQFDYRGQHVCAGQ